MYYCKFRVFDNLFIDTINIFKKFDFSCISIDTSICTNKFNYELSHKIPYLKNKRAAKIVCICDNKCNPIAMTITDLGDSVSFFNTYNFRRRIK